jgi:hypothetical protein
MQEWCRLEYAPLLIATYNHPIMTRRRQPYRKLKRDEFLRASVSYCVHTMPMDNDDINFLYFLSVLYLYPEILMTHIPLHEKQDRNILQKVSLLLFKTWKSFSFLLIPTIPEILQKITIG